MTKRQSASHSRKCGILEPNNSNSLSSCESESEPNALISMSKTFRNAFEDGLLTPILTSEAYEESTNSVACPLEGHEDRDIIRDESLEGHEDRDIIRDEPLEGHEDRDIISDESLEGHEDIDYIADTPLDPNPITVYTVGKQLECHDDFSSLSDHSIRPLENYDHLYNVPLEPYEDFYGSSDVSLESH